MDRLTHLFVSDLHLGSDTPDIERAFGALLSSLPELKHLFILGDWFDLWIGDDAQPTVAERVGALLQALSLDELVFVPGNRDFLLGDGYLADLGAQHHESCNVRFAGHDFLLTHGDEYCVDDLDYMAWRSTCRNQEWQSEFLKQSVSARQEFANKARGQSASRGSVTNEAISDVVPRALPKRPLIHGHTHRPSIHRGESIRVVLGDWRPEAWVAVGNQESGWLAKFDGKTFCQTLSIYAAGRSRMPE